MPRPTKGPRLGSGPTHQKMMLEGLASQLIIHERIRTTETKAKRLRPLADRLITLGKDGSVHARRRALGMIEDRAVIHKLFAEVAPRFAERNGGYTRVLKLGTRQGDAAPMAIIEFVEGSVESAPPAEAEQRRRRGLRRRKPAKPAAEAAQTSEASSETETEPEEEPGVMQGAEEEPGAMQGAEETPADESGGETAEVADVAGEAASPESAEGAAEPPGAEENGATQGGEEPSSEDKG